MAVATRPAEVNGLGLNVSDALKNIRALRTRVQFLEETEHSFDRLTVLIGSTNASGRQIDDANLAAVALAHQADAILTANPDHFRRFSDEIEIIALSTWKPAA